MAPEKMAPATELDKLASEIDTAFVDRTHNVVDYSAYIAIFLKLVIWAFRRHFWRAIRDE